MLSVNGGQGSSRARRRPLQSKEIHFSLERVEAAER
ncbi:MAG: hypothetical protein AVDCRST_MAG78-918 [uncultured Rubrobacteraceae bacterium]|uniref:Uncharacterized protein n=1 Tax=uncultured Rubrobacteraceae bacterium TaxID=349277 RepID=A0A6J4PMB0_9ACTN|nr:MAG: hypothetical protein AVDCRST_MAG78-918 [uncultured Rubrobacteraceae bacterium]